MLRYLQNLNGQNNFEEKAFSTMNQFASIPPVVFILLEVLIFSYFPNLRFIFLFMNVAKFGEAYIFITTPIPPPSKKNHS